VRNGVEREVELYPPCRDDSCEFYQEWSRVDLGRGFRMHCVNPDHPDYPRARSDEKCPGMKVDNGRRARAMLKNPGGEPE
jgi:hypothetical protein